MWSKPPKRSAKTALFAREVMMLRDKGLQRWDVALDFFEGHLTHLHQRDDPA